MCNFAKDVLQLEKNSLFYSNKKENNDYINQSYKS